MEKKECADWFATNSFECDPLAVPGTALLLNMGDDIRWSCSVSWH